MSDPNKRDPKSFQCPVMKNVTHPLRFYEFTPDEMRVLEECDRESFYQRCLPFSTLLASATYAAVRFGFLSKSPHWGVFPKVVTMALLGYVLGRIAYIPHCDEKLRNKLPKDSHLANTMRRYFLEKNPPPPKTK